MESEKVKVDFSRLSQLVADLRTISVANIGRKS